ncbi:MAG: Uma2 family endonuclease, partial [Planctomycetota bacterium]
PPQSVRPLYITADDDGRFVDFGDWWQADFQTDLSAELSRGVVVVADVPSGPHEDLANCLRIRLSVWAANRSPLPHVSGGHGSRLPIPPFGSDRHPDIALYLTRRPVIEGRDLWRRWVPELVVEIVSESSRTRDVELKPSEYLAFGCSEYWIVDRFRRTVRRLVRDAGEWTAQELTGDDALASELLPGFRISLPELWASIEASDDKD